MSEAQDGQPTHDRLSLFMVEYRVTQLERTSTELKSKMETLATKDDVAGLRKDLAKKDDWLMDKLLAPGIVGAILIAFEIFAKTSGAKP